MSIERSAGTDGATVRAVVPIPLVLAGRTTAASMVSFDGLVDTGEHVALLLGSPCIQPAPLVRLHSECLTGDVFGSARCDCGAQLTEALDATAEVGGIVLYLRQEGRGIGLYNKLDAYRLQDAGYDTFAANRALNLGEDMRDYGVAVQMLRALGVSAVTLLSNNPEKVSHLRRGGIRVASLRRTGVFLTSHNRSYLQAKASLGRHLIDVPGDHR